MPVKVIKTGIGNKEVADIMPKIIPTLNQIHNYDYLAVTNDWIENFKKYPFVRALDFERFYSNYRDSLWHLTAVKTNNNPIWVVDERIVRYYYQCWDEGSAKLLIIINPFKHKKYITKNIIIDEKNFEFLDKKNYTIKKQSPFRRT